jgi:3-oxoacyl-[acyl-carrier protein] reductase
MSLHGKVAVVTGGSRGIGRAICLELARRGASVVFSYAGNDNAARETETLCAPFSTVRGVRADVTDGEAVKALMDSVVKEFGRIDILVNNAGITRDNLTMLLKEEDFDQVLNTNLKGAFLCAKAVCRTMMKQKFGRIINLSSVVGLRGNAGQVNYAASKAGLIGLTKSMAKELASRGVTVNAVAPGYISTDMTAALPESAKTALLDAIPMKKLGEGADVAAAVAFFAGDEAGYITGQVLCVDGGMAV